MSKISYLENKAIKIKGDILSRISVFFEGKVKSSIIGNKNSDSENIVNFIIEDKILSDIVFLSIEFILAKDEIRQTNISVIGENEKINEYHLKNYLTNMYGEVLLGEHNEDLKKYVVRTYLRIFNSSNLKGEYEFNFGGRFLLKPIQITDRDEPLSENVILFDSEISAVNIDQARSIAYNSTCDVAALLALLLDVGFEPITSEFRIFVEKEGNSLKISRKRTGFIDAELGFVVKDNMNGLEHVRDREVEIDRRVPSGCSFRLLEEETGGLGEHVIIPSIPKKYLTAAFENHKIKRDKKIVPLYREEIERRYHFMNSEINMPQCLRGYVNGYVSLSADKKDAYLSCARMYNIALTAGRNEPTLAAAYIICAIEALALGLGLKFSEFLLKFADKNFDKKLTDYFYSSVRSAHFHAGKLLFNESSINLQSEFDLLFSEKQNDYIRFYNIARGSIINWVDEEILNKKGV